MRTDMSAPESLSKKPRSSRPSRPVPDRATRTPVPPIVYPEDLPVSGRREEIAQAIRDHQVVLGLVSSKTGKLESREELKKRIAEAAEFVPLNQLCLSPQCGFSSTEAGNILTEEEQWNKIRLVAETASEVW